MGISWSYRQSGEAEAEFPFNFLNRGPHFTADRGNRNLRSDSSHRSAGTRARSRGEGQLGRRDWRDLLRMSGVDELDRSNTDSNRRSAESDYDERGEESFAAILSSLIPSGQLISREGTYGDDDFVMDNADELASDGGDVQKESGGSASNGANRLKSSDIKTIVELNSGRFSVCQRTATGRRSILNRLRNRELGGGVLRQSSAPLNDHLTQGDKCYISNHMLPNAMSKIDTYRSKVFCGQYTKDGRVLITACQDQRIRFYDMTRLSDSGITRVRPDVSASGSSSAPSGLPFNSVEANDVGWSILDVAVSPDGRHVVYSSWSDYIHQCSIYEGRDENHAAFHLHMGEDRFCIFSLRFSADGNEILAGASDCCLYVYDRQRNTRALKIAAHDDDVNAVCFADDASHIVYSGGDDGLCKVWDRRTLSEDNPQPVGILAGHAGGITFIDSKADARYLISNSKDQSVKLWDIRKFSNATAIHASRAAALVSKQGWDYRWQNVPRKVLKYRCLEGDSSVMTYRDRHTVLHTLIRCFFSPAFSTGQRFVYTGCASGACVVYDLLTGQLAKRLKGHHACVRDVSWHPYRNEICTTSWDATVARWTFDGRTDSDYEDGSSRSDTEDSSDAEDIGYSTSGAGQTAAGRLLRLYRRRQAPLRRSERLREQRRRGMPSLRFD